MFRFNITKLKVKRFIYFVILIVVLNIFGAFTHFFEKDFYTDFHYPYDGDIFTSVQQLKNGEKPDIDPINSYDYKFLKNCSMKCSEKNVRLVFLIKSSPENFDRRSSIRHSWGFEKRFSDVPVKRLFLLGNRNDEKLQRLIDIESQENGDIIQADFKDTYFNNTIKTMIGFKWAVTYCPDAKYYMFVDDDYYVSLKNVLRFLRHPTNYPKYLTEPLSSLKNALLNRKKRQVFEFELPDDVRLYTGYVFLSSPHRHYTSKWYVSLEEYPYHLWPPYVTAGAYILSKNSIIDMYYTSFYTKHFRFDDIYVGLLAYKAKVEPFHCNEFYFSKKPYWPKNYIFTVASHGFSDAGELMRVWTEQKSLGNA